MLKFLLHGYGEFDAGHPIRGVVWPHFDLLFVHRGRLALRIGEGAERGGRMVELKGGDGALIYPQTVFSGDAIGKKVRASVQHFALEGGGENAVLRKWLGRRTGFALVKRELAGSLTRDVERALELARGARGEVNAVLRVSQLTLLLSQFRDAGGKGDENGAEGLRELMVWARQRNGVVSVGELVARAGYSHGHFRILFERAFGETPAGFLLRLRVNEAKRLLGESRCAIKEIAGALGYGDVVAFHRAFAREAGISPGAYRRRVLPVG